MSVGTVYSTRVPAERSGQERASGRLGVAERTKGTRGANRTVPARCL